MLGNKTKTALWVITDKCNAAFDMRGATHRGGTHRYFDELKLHGLRMHVSSHCFTHHSHVNINAKAYKFFVIFENAECIDYITHRLFEKALLNEAVPVVMGGIRGDYELLAPPQSFIHVGDFPSIKTLVQYLEYLDKNDEAYLTHMKWRTLSKEGIIEYRTSTSFCRLCQVLHQSRTAKSDKSSRLTHRRVGDLHDWWYHTEDPVCIASYKMNIQFLCFVIIFSLISLSLFYYFLFYSSQADLYAKDKILFNLK